MILAALDFLLACSLGWIARCLFERKFTERDAWALIVMGAALLALTTAIRE